MSEVFAFFFKMLNFVTSSPAGSLIKSINFSRMFAHSGPSLMEKVEKVIEERVRPVLAMDGGNIKLKSIDKDGVVNVILEGHCSGCPSRRLTLNSGILACLQEEFGTDLITDIREIE